ncbi:ATPase [Enterococcus plantarum]|uniref:Sporulation initiation inhibitor protein Soj n=1 Tax=Enterococcus plantarum TaxID=1077675 RepID=A0A2W4A951_9ENTE|nr:AAA family ATPase [Enterococcus plantarum]PZL77493.1 ATPase [Enterococcus plantarum]
MATVISFAMQKGGAGKTTTVKNTMVELAKLNKKVLGIDIDAQGSLTIGCTNAIALSKAKSATMSDIFLNGAKLSDIIIPIEENIDIAPALISLANVDLSLASQIAREHFLRRALTEVKDDYDFILIDCPPSLSLLTVNALTASDFVVYVVQLEYFAFEGLIQLEKTVAQVQGINENLKVLGIIETMSDRTNHTSDISDSLTNYNSLGKIDRATDVRDAIMNKQAISQYIPGHKVANQYEQFAKNMIAAVELAKEVNI